MRHLACLVALVGCATPWRQVDVRRISPQPHQPQEAFVVTRDEAFHVALTAASADTLHGYLHGAWQRPVARFSIRESDEPDDVAGRNGWVKLPATGAREIRIATVQYASIPDPGARNRSTAGAIAALVGVAAIVGFVAFVGSVAP
jgi:hypothetical protein